MNTLHIIDAIVLGGVDIRQLPLYQRNKVCQKFAKALEKPYACSSHNTPIRCKRLFKLTELDSFFDRLTPRTLKDGSKKMGYDIRTPHCETSVTFHIPRGLLLMNEVRSDRMRVFSVSQNRIYYFEKTTKEAKFPEQLTDVEKFASSKNTYTTRLLWKWDRKEQIFETIDEKYREADLLYRKELDAFINSKQTNKQR